FCGIDMVAYPERAATDDRAAVGQRGQREAVCRSGWGAEGLKIQPRQPSRVSLLLTGSSRTDPRTGRPAWLHSLPAGILPGRRAERKGEPGRLPRGTDRASKSVTSSLDAVGHRWPCRCQEMMVPRILVVEGVR